MIEIRDLKEIRTFYPSQWEGRTATGEAVCIRYKHGELSVSIYEGNGPSSIPYCEPLGETHGFEMDTEEMKAHLAAVCRFVDGGKESAQQLCNIPGVSNE